MVVVVGVVGVLANPPPPHPSPSPPNHGRSGAANPRAPNRLAWVPLPPWGDEAWPWGGPTCERDTPHPQIPPGPEGVVVVGGSSRGGWRRPRAPVQDAARVTAGGVVGGLGGPSCGGDRNEQEHLGRGVVWGVGVVVSPPHTPTRWQKPLVTPPPVPPPPPRREIAQKGPGGSSGRVFFQYINPHK